MNPHDMCNSFKILYSYASGSSKPRSSNHNLHKVEKEQNPFTIEGLLSFLNTNKKNTERKRKEECSHFCTNPYNNTRKNQSNHKTNIGMNQSPVISDFVVSSYEDLLMNKNNCYNFMKKKCSENKQGEYIITQKKKSKNVKEEIDYSRTSSSERDRHISSDGITDYTKIYNECPEKQRTNLNNSFYKYNSLKNKNECYINRKSSSHEKEIDERREIPKLDIDHYSYLPKPGNKNPYCYISSSFSSLRKCNSASNDELGIRKGKSEEIYKNKNHVPTQESNKNNKNIRVLENFHHTLLNNNNNNNMSGTNELNIMSSNNCVKCKKCKNYTNDESFKIDRERNYFVVMYENSVSPMRDTSEHSKEPNKTKEKEEEEESIYYNELSDQQQNKNLNQNHLQRKDNGNLKQCYIRRSYLSDKDILYSESAGSSSFEKESSFNETLCGTRSPIRMNKKVQSDSLLFSNREYLMNSLFNSPYSSNSSVNSKDSLDDYYEKSTKNKKLFSSGISAKSMEKEEYFSHICEDCFNKWKKKKKKRRKIINCCKHIDLRNNPEKEEKLDRHNFLLCLNTKNIQESSFDLLTTNEKDSSSNANNTPKDNGTNRNGTVFNKEVSNIQISEKFDKDVSHFQTIEEERSFHYFNTNKVEKRKKAEEDLGKEISSFYENKNHACIPNDFLQSDSPKINSYKQKEGSTFSKECNGRSYCRKDVKGGNSDNDNEPINKINKYKPKGKSSKELIKECRKTLSKKILTTVYQKNKRVLLWDSDLSQNKNHLINIQRNPFRFFSQMRSSKSTELYETTQKYVERHSASYSKIIVPNQILHNGKKEIYTTLNSMKLKIIQTKNIECGTCSCRHQPVINSIEPIHEVKEPKVLPSNSNKTSISNHSNKDLSDVPRQMLQHNEPVSHVLIQRKDSSISDGILYNCSNDSTKERLDRITYLFRPNYIKKKRNESLECYTEKVNGTVNMEVKEKEKKKKIIEGKTVLQQENKEALEERLKSIESREGKETNSNTTLLTNTKIQNPINGNIKNKMNAYCIVGLIDYGMKSQVYKCINMNDKKVYALKVVSKESSPLNGNDFIEKYNFLKKNPHKNIIHIYDVYEDEENNFIIMELCKGPTLLDYFMTLMPGTLQVYEIKQIMWNIFRALDFLHSRNIIHRDVKFENLMFKREIPSNDYENYESFDRFSYRENSSSFLKKEYQSPCRRNEMKISRAHWKSDFVFKNRNMINLLNNEKKHVQSIDVIRYEAISSGSLYSNQTDNSNDSILSSFYCERKRNSIDVSSDQSRSIISSSYEEMNRMDSLNSSRSFQSHIYFNEYECKSGNVRTSEVLHGSNTRIILSHKNPQYEEKILKRMQSKISTFPYSHKTGTCNKVKCNYGNDNEHNCSKRENVFNNLSLIDMDLMELVESNKLFMKTKTDMICGTAPYMSPESLEGIIYTGNDTWACGVILYALMDGHFPFEINNSMPTYIKQHILTKTKPKFDPAVWHEHPELFDLCVRLLDPNPLTRIQNAREALIHCCFNEILYQKNT